MNFIQTFYQVGNEILAVNPESLKTEKVAVVSQISHSSAQPSRPDSITVQFRDGAIMDIDGGWLSRDGGGME